jgi:hypothetical protein
VDTVIHAGMSLADQLQPVVVDTKKLPVVPPAGAETLAGVTE